MWFARRAAVTLVLCVALYGCLGSGTKRLDAPCREMVSPVAYELLKDNPGVTVLDVRRASEVTPEQKRFPGAVVVPIDRLPFKTHDLWRLRNSTVVVFGSDGDEGRQACQLLSDKGFRYVIFVSDGAAGWFGAGLPPLPGTPSPTPTPAASAGSR